VWDGENQASYAANTDRSRSNIRTVQHDKKNYIKSNCITEVQKLMRK
jgi:hypothetical protein